MSEQNAIIISGTSLNDHFDNLNELFIKAKQKDEFEFCCTILRIRGMEGPGWDTFIQNYSNLIRLIEIMQEETEFQKQIVLLLQLYVQCIEVNDIYNVVLNLIRVLKGERYSLAPFNNELYTTNINARYPKGKIERIQEQSKLHYNYELSDLFEFTFVRQVRNAVSHSDYTIFEDKFRIISGEGVNINNIITPEVPLEWLVPRINTAINTSLYIYNNVFEHRESYKEDKIIKGRILPSGDYSDIQLLADENGLRGFIHPVKNTDLYNI